MSRLVRYFRFFFLRRRLRARGLMPPAFAAHWWRRRGARAPDWRLTILAEIDEKRGLINPSAFIAGTPVIQGRVVFELRNELGPVRPPLEKPLPIGEPRPMLTLPAIPLPKGTTAGDVASWCWRVRLENGRGRVLARWSKRLVSAGALNCEAELDL